MNRTLQSRQPPRKVPPLVARDPKDPGRADRIRQLKRDRPGMTWSYIANRVGVEVRSAQEWRRTGGISPKNAEKLADIFGVSYDYLWFGKEKTATPDLLAGVSKVEQVEAVRDEFRGYVQTLIEEVRRNRLEIETQNELLAQQQELLDQQTLLLAELREEQNVLNAAQRVLAALEAQTEQRQGETAGHEGDVAPPKEERRRPGDRRGDGSRRTG